MEINICLGCGGPTSDLNHWYIQLTYKIITRGARDFGGVVHHDIPSLTPNNTKYFTTCLYPAPY